MNKEDVFSAVMERYPETQESHLDEMSIDELCEQRQRVSRKIKELEAERKVIDESLMDYLSEAELKHGVKLKSGSYIKMRTRTSYKYPDALDKEIKSLRQLSRDMGEGYSETTTYLVLV